MIQAEEAKVLSDLVMILDKFQLPMMLVGAGARLLVFDERFGQGRSTKDWDIAISVDNWDKYEEICKCLVDSQEAGFQATKIPHRFKHQKTKIDIDIIPFGKIDEPDQQIVWPKTDSVMNLIGYKEALSFAEEININNAKIKVINIPAFVVLKIFAWGDRGGGRRNTSDLEDIEFIFNKYEDIERVYSELPEELGSGRVDYLDANIYLLGRDICKIFQKQTLSALNMLLNEMIQKFSDEEDSRSFGHKLNVLQKGINST